MADDETPDDKIRRLFPDMPLPSELEASSQTFQEKVQDLDLREMVSLLQNEIVTAGAANIHGVFAVIVTKDAADSRTIYSNGCYATDQGMALSIAGAMMAIDLIKDEADERHLAMIEAQLGDEEDD